MRAEGGYGVPRWVRAPKRFFKGGKRLGELVLSLAAKAAAMNSGSRTVSTLAAAQQRAPAFDDRPGLPCSAKADCQHGKAKSRGPSSDCQPPYRVDLVWGAGGL